MEVNLPAGHFAEGLTTHAGIVYVTTWKQNAVHALRAADLQYLGKISFQKQHCEGWGLATDGTHLIMSGGSACLNFYRIPDAASFTAGHEDLQLVRTMCVRDPRGNRVFLILNELEYVRGCIYANVWPTDNIGTGTHRFYHIWCEFIRIIVCPFARSS
jgi:glutamine cyclotransferase